MVHIDEVLKSGFGGSARSESHTLLPDPEPRERLIRLVSADDHLVEPPHLFEGRLPAKFAPRAPHIVELDDGTQLWDIDGQLMPNVGFNAVAGRPREEMSMEPMRFDEIRRGTWDIHERVNDMDLDGVDASLCFPSNLSGFAGQKYSLLADQDYGYALFRAWNDWHIEEWAGESGGRMIPCQIAWLNDPEVAAQNVRDNAARGFKAITFPENPQAHGFPSLHTTWWDPFLAACEETGTIMCLHLGSSSVLMSPTPDCGDEEIMMLFPVVAQVTAVEWLFARIPLRFPRIKVDLRAGGIGWVPMMLDRLEHYEKNFLDYAPQRNGWDIGPTEALRRNFWFCSLRERSVAPIVDRIGIDRILFEVDYPHADSIWPDSQRRLLEDFGSLPKDDLEQIAHGNADALFQLTPTD